MVNSNGGGLGHIESNNVSQRHCFVGHSLQIRPTPHPCKCKQIQAQPTLCNFLRTGNNVTRG